MKLDEIVFFFFLNFSYNIFWKQSSQITNDLYQEKKILQLQNKYS